MTREAARIVPIVLFLTSAAAVGWNQQRVRFPMTPERLVARVDAFWKAWQAQSLYRVFMLYAPSYRNGTTESAFYELTRGMLSITPLEYKVSKVEMSEDGSKGIVTLDAQTIIPPLGTVPNKLVQHWVYEEGDWYKLMDPPSLPTTPATPGGSPSAAGEPLR